MQKIFLVVVGETKDTHIASLEKDLLTRCKKYFQLERVVVSPAQFLSEDQIAKGVAEETAHLLSALKNAPQPIIYLDVAGKLHDTPEFAHRLQQLKDEGKSITFVIGGAYGVDVAALAPNGRMSLSPMTTTHELVRVFFLEQVYRAGSINAGSRYHH